MAKTDFDLAREIDAFVSRITAQIISRELREKVAREYKEHLEDSVYSLMLLGKSEQEAFASACERMGSVEATGCLLGEVHNKAYMPSVFLKRLLSRIKATLTSKSFLKGFIIAAVITVALGIIIGKNFLLIADRAVALAAHFSSTEGRGQMLIFALATVLIFGYILFIKYGVQIIIYVLSRIRNYFRICFFSLTRGGRVRLTRFPFWSLTGLSERGDLEIKINGERYAVHFVDVIFKYRRELVIVNDEKYALVKIIPDRLGAFGQKLADGKSYYNAYRSVIIGHSFGGAKFKSLPPVHADDERKHIIIADPIPVEKSVIRKGKKQQLDNGDTCGSYKSFTVTAFIKYIKRM